MITTVAKISKVWDGSYLRLKTDLCHFRLLFCPTLQLAHGLGIRSQEVLCNWSSDDSTTQDRKALDVGQHRQNETRRYDGM